MDKQSAVIQKGFIFYLLIFYLVSCNNPIGTDLPKENPETADCYFPPANGGGIGTGLKTHISIRIIQMNLFT